MIYLELCDGVGKFVTVEELVHKFATNTCVVTDTRTGRKFKISGVTKVGSKVFVTLRAGDYYNNPLPLDDIDTLVTEQGHTLVELMFSKSEVTLKKLMASFCVFTSSSSSDASNVSLREVLAKLESFSGTRVFITSEVREYSACVLYYDKEENQFVVSTDISAEYLCNAEMISATEYLSLLYEAVPLRVTTASNILSSLKAFREEDEENMSNKTTAALAEYLKNSFPLVGNYGFTEEETEAGDQNDS